MICVFFLGRKLEGSTESIFDKAGNRTYDPWFTRHSTIPLYHGGFNSGGSRGGSGDWLELPSLSETKLFHFHGIFKKNKIKSAKRAYHTFIHMNPLSIDPRSTPGKGYQQTTLADIEAMTMPSSGVVRTPKKLRTSKGDYWIKQ